MPRNRGGSPCRLNKRSTRFMLALLLPFPVLWTITVQAQIDIRFTRTSLEQGLSQSSAQCILQGPDGMIWIGTQNGLNRYDGRNILSWHYDPYKAGSMSNSTVLCMERDERGYLWIGTMGGGLMRFDPGSIWFSSLLDTSGPGRLDESIIWSLEYDRSRSLLWIGAKGLYSYHTDNQELNMVPLTGTPLGKALGESSIMCILAARDGTVWLGTNLDGLIRFRPETGEAISYRHDPDKPGSLSDNIVWSISEDEKGGLWVATNHGLNHLPNDGERFTAYFAGNSGLGDDLVWSLLHDRSGDLWAGTNNGLSRLDRQTGRFITSRHQPANPFSLSNNVVWSLHQDPSGVIFAGTNDGFNSFARGLTRFRNFFDRSGDNTGYPDEPVSSILEDRQGFIWAGTEGGGLCQIGAGGLIRTWKQDPANPGSLSGDRIWALMQDREGLIWVGTYGNGLNRLDPQTGRANRFLNDPSDPGSLPNDRVLSIMEDSRENLWIGTRGGGLARMDRKRGTFRTWIHSDADSLSLSGNTVTCILEDSRNRLWVGTFGDGLNLFDRDRKVFTRFLDTLGRPFLTHRADIWNILEDGNGTIWVGTSAGLFRIDRIDMNSKILTFRQYTTMNGLPDNQILGLLGDQKGNIWISSVKGIARLDPITGKIRRYTVSDGLQSNEFFQGAYHRSPSGKLYFGGLHGINAFHPDEIADLPFDAPVLLTGLKLFYTDVQISSPGVPPDTGDDPGASGRVSVIPDASGYHVPLNLCRIRELELSHRQNVITFDFVAPHFFRAAEISYSCTMEGFEEQWNNLGTTGRITYTNLDPGSYLLRVRAENADQVVSPHELSLRVVIRTPFWMKAWFLAPAIALLLAALILSVQRIVRRQYIRKQTESEREREMLELQMKAIRSQINPHFAFNAISSIGSFIYENDSDKTYDYITKFSRLIRHAMQNTDKLYVPLNEEIEFIRTYLELERGRFKDKFIFTLEVDPLIDKNTQVPKMILHTHTENAVKHGISGMESGGVLNIRVDQQGDSLVFLIRDNGIGRMESAGMSKYSTHRGLKIIDQLYDLHFRIHGKKILQAITDLVDVQGAPAGTEIRITYPVLPD